MKEGSLPSTNRSCASANASGLIIRMLLNIVISRSRPRPRIWLASRRGSLMEFGLRRAQGFDGAMSASRAAYIGGAAGTSNTLAGKTWGIPVMGTMAHAWVMSHPDEKTAFNAYAEQYPDKSVFLIDTYDTLGSGIEAAIDAGKMLAGKGKNFGVRLDSGDIQYLSVAVRKALDEAGLTKATITVSNELTEEIVESLVLNGSPIDFWGVGTHMVTGGSESSLTGVYKLSAKTGADGRLSRSWLENPEKATNPGVKQVWRLYNEDGSMEADISRSKAKRLKRAAKCDTSTRRIRGRALPSPRRARKRFSSRRCAQGETSPLPPRFRRSGPGPGSVRQSTLPISGYQSPCLQGIAD